MRKTNTAIGAILRALLIYGLLIGGAAIFTLPFAWMIGTSFKVDREMFGEKITILPGKPLPRQASPYLDTTYFAPPRGARWTEARPVIEEALRARGQEPALAAGVFQRLEQILPSAFWAGAWTSQLPDKISDDLVAEVLRKVQRHLSLGAVRVRSVDLQETDITAGAPVSEFWKVEGAAARLVDGDEGGTPYADLAYDFGSDPNGEVRLSHTIDLPFPVDRLQKIQLYLRPDDSWHPVEFFVEMKGKVFKGKRPEFMGNFQWSVVTLQELGPDDASTKIRLWIPLVEQPGAGLDGDRQAKITLVMKRASQFDAWWAKCQRNYRGALDYIPFWRYTATSVLLVLLNIVCTVFSCSIVAFAFARLQWPGRNISFGLMLATMMIPSQVTMIPYFLIVKSLGWYNTLTPLWVMSLTGNAFNIFLLRQFMKGIPRDLEDAARIDGCNSWQVYWNVIMPLIKPTLACIAIFTFMGVWNDFMGPLIYLSDQRLYPLSLGLYAFNVQSGANFGMMMAGSLLMTLPVIMIFFFAQKYFIQGVTLTGMKG